jgi:exo-beta-1,3-glucanase (GH17 family)
MAQGRFIAYEPTAMRVVNGTVMPADAASIAADLAVLRPRFDGLITYGALHGAEAIPALASAQHYRALVIGIWDPLDDAEVEAALTAARAYPRLVVGVSLGNEVLFFKSRSFAELAAAIARLHARAPQLAVSTSEPFHMYYEPQAALLLAQADFLLANVHPVYQPWFRTATAAQDADFVVHVVADLADRFCGPILVKETGEPTAPASEGYSSLRQGSFYGALRNALPPSAAHAFAYFSAFDAPWRRVDASDRESEAHWGLYDERRQPKPWVMQLPALPGR